MPCSLVPVHACSYLGLCCIVSVPRFVFHEQGLTAVTPRLRRVVGLRNGWQTALVMAGLTTKIHAKRLAQGTEVVLEMRAAGEWPFPCWVDLKASGNSPLGFRVKCRVIPAPPAALVLRGMPSVHGAGMRCPAGGSGKASDACTAAGRKWAGHSSVMSRACLVCMSRREGRHVADAHAARRRALATDHPRRQEPSPHGDAPSLLHLMVPTPTFTASCRCAALYLAMECSECMLVVLLSRPL